MSGERATHQQLTPYDQKPATANDTPMTTDQPPHYAAEPDS